MTFADLKTEVLTRAKSLELCPAYQAALIATDRNGLLAAVSQLFIWCYQAGVVDDTLLNEFLDSELNPYGIYKGGENLTNPTTDVYYLKTGSPTVTLNGNNKCKIAVMGAVSLTLNIGDNSYADVKAFDSSHLIMSISSFSNANVEGTQDSNVSVAVNDNSFAQLILSDRVTAEYTGNDNSHGIIKGFNHSQTTYTLNDSATIQANAYNQASVTNTAL